MSVHITNFAHGTTTDNENELSTGWLPGELSEKGIEQAKELGVLVKDRQFDVMFCSDLKRAIDSVALGFGDKYPVIQDARLRECNYGDWNGKSTEFKDGKMKQYIDTPFPNGESYKDVEHRMHSFLADLKENYEGKNVAMLTHEGPQLALEVLLKGKTWDQAIDENWRNTKSWQPGWEYELI